MYSELFTMSVYYLCKQPYLQCEKEKNELSFSEQGFSYFIWAIENQHIILMEEVFFCYFTFTILRQHFSGVVI